MTKLKQKTIKIEPAKLQAFDRKEYEEIKKL
jgi:hypothetical protein